MPGGLRSWLRSLAAVDYEGGIVRRGAEGPAPSSSRATDAADSHIALK
jgi:hypothetical protein